ncbi:MAG: tetratricopeptide repeat protein [Bacteroidia bacterium]
MKRLFTLYYSLCTIYCFAQNRKIDSLLQLVKQDNATSPSPSERGGVRCDTNKVIHLNKLSREYLNIGYYDTAVGCANTSLAICNSPFEGGKGDVLTDKQIASLTLAMTKGKAAAYTNIGNVYYLQGNYHDALKNHFAALEIREAIDDKDGIASSYNNIGLVYFSQGNYPDALKIHFASLKIREAIGDKLGISASYNNIGNVYSSQGNYPDALKNHFAALKIREAIGDKQGIAASYNNIGNVYSSQGNCPDALKFNFAALKIREAIDDKQGIATSYNNIGNVYSSQGNYLDALKNHFASLKIKEAIGDKDGIASSYINIGAVYVKAPSLPPPLGEEKKGCVLGEKYLQKALALSKQIGSKDAIRDSYRGLTVADSTMGNYKLQIMNYKLYIIYKDSLDNEETRKKTIQSQMTYDFEKKEAVANATHKSELDKQAAIAEEKSKKQKFVIWSVISGLLLVVVFASFVVRSLRITSKQKYIIELQKTQILDSINYARYIQQSILADDNEIRTYLKDFFVLYLPKDIVSGDFYWFTKQGTELFFASIDCTGHGVPGAFLSMIGSTLLNEIVNFKKITDPYTIIEGLAEGVTNTLSHKKDKNDAFSDGMDISICKINIETRKFYFASANHHIFVVDDTGLTQLDPQVKSVHGVFALSTKKGVSTTEVSLNPGAMIYMATDGYTDQVGEQSKKKLMLPKFKEMLSQVYKLPVEGQKIRIEQTLLEWKGNRKQNDDILVMGFRVP